MPVRFHPEKKRVGSKERGSRGLFRDKSNNRGNGLWLIDEGASSSFSLCEKGRFVARRKRVVSASKSARGSPRKEERNVRFGDSIYVKSVDRLPSRWIKWRGDQTLCKAVESFAKLIRIHPALERIIGEFGKIRRVEEWYS